MKASIDEIISDLKAVHAKFTDEPYARKWLFEYACQVLEKENLPVVENMPYHNWVMRNKLHSVYEAARKLYDSKPYLRKQELTFPPMKSIPLIVIHEHSKTKQLK